MTALRLLLASLFWLGTQVVPVLAQTEQCSLCVGGSEPNLENTIGGAEDGPSCASLVSDVEVDLDGCRELQLLGYQWCDCPDYPQDYFCPMCQDAFVDIPNRFQRIPGTGQTCDDKLFVKASTVDSCADAMIPGYVCGCPNAEEPDCYICGGTTKDVIENPDEPLTIDGVGSYTCQELIDQAVLGNLTVEQCGLVQEVAFETCGCVETSPPLEEVESESSNVTIPEETDQPIEPIDSSPSANPQPEASPPSSSRASTLLACLGTTLASQLLLHF